MKAIPGLATLLLLAACATAPSPGPYAPADTSFTGWVRFSNDEFQLYADQVQVLRPFSRPCVSGAGSRDEMRQAVQDLNNAKVRITGRAVPWVSAEASRIQYEGSVIRNDCGGTYVILADDIRPAN